MFVFSASLIYSQNKKNTNEKIVTYYHDKFHGRKTSNGDIYNKNLLTCASTNKYPFGTVLKVTNLDNNKSTIVIVNDRGNFTKYGVYLDLSKKAFQEIGKLEKGRLRVSVEVLDNKTKEL